MPLADGSLWPLAAFAAVGVWWWTRQRKRLRRPRRNASAKAPAAVGIEKRLAALEVRLFDYERELASAHATRLAVLENKIAEATAVAERLEQAVAAAAEFDFTVKLPEPTDDARETAARHLRQAGYDDAQIDTLLDRGWDERRAA